MGDFKKHLFLMRQWSYRSEEKLDRCIVQPWKCIFWYARKGCLLEADCLVSHGFGGPMDSEHGEAKLTDSVMMAASCQRQKKDETWGKKLRRGRFKKKRGKFPFISI
jgi:hypothetical protein